MPNLQDDNVSVIDGASNKVVENIDHGSFFNIDEIGVNPVTNRIYVTTLRGVSVIDGKTIQVVDTIKGVNSPVGIGVNTVTNRIYVANRVTTSVMVIDGNTNRVIDNIFIFGALNVDSIAVNPITNRVYVSAFAASALGGALRSDSRIISQNEGVYVIDGETNNVIDTITLSGSKVVGVNPTTNHVFVPNVNGVSVIDGERNEIIDTITLENIRIESIGINPSSNLIYITNFRSSDVTVIKDDMQQNILESDK